MGRPPAVVIVTRHGARLDAADAHWHLTSPAPYDSPLTYGGWIQCRSLGGKIASLLRARELLFQQTLKDSLDGIQAGSNGSDATHGHGLLRRRKKHRIIIHSSPFLRCVQTSVAISAGISQYRDFNETPSNSHTDEHVPNVPRTTKSGQRKLSSIPDEDETGLENSKSNANDFAYFKPRLRIDAFLGEWLSPDYYESITPPPSSIMMVATAKAELLRRGEGIQILDHPKMTPSEEGNFPGGWSSRPESASSQRSDADDLGRNLADTQISQAVPSARNRARTQGDIGSFKERADALPVKRGVGYVAPVPPYAVLPSEPIPAGYVHHAQEACVDVDFQWDSMRAPQDWGDGGELGEEWSAMHKRFRKGLHSLVSWYALHRETALQSHGRSRVLHPHAHEPADDDDTDLVVILVTHGAGCNALIGALTNQPVLLDVAMASLTMAVYRERDDSNEGPRTSYNPISPSLPRYANERPLATDYTVTLTASTEHLTHNPFMPLSLSDLKSQPRIPTESSVVRRSSRRRFNPIPIVGHDRSASLSQLPTNIDAGSNWGLSRSNTGMESGTWMGSAGSSSTGNVQSPPRSVPDSTVTSPTTTSQPGLWSRPSPRDAGGHPRTWSLLSQGSSVSSDAPSIAGMVASPTRAEASAGSNSPGWLSMGSHEQNRGRTSAAAGPTSAPMQHTGNDGVAVEDHAENDPAEDPLLAPLSRLTTIESDEIQERERGAKRRWTTSQRGLQG